MLTFFSAAAWSWVGAPGGRALRSGQGQAVLRVRPTERRDLGKGEDRRRTRGSILVGGECETSSSPASWVNGARTAPERRGWIKYARPALLALIKAAGASPSYHPL